MPHQINEKQLKALNERRKKEAQMGGGRTSKQSAGRAARRAALNPPPPSQEPAVSSPVAPAVFRPAEPPAPHATPAPVETPVSAAKRSAPRKKTLAPPPLREPLLDFNTPPDLGLPRGLGRLPTFGATMVSRTVQMPRDGLSKHVDVWLAEQGQEFTAVGRALFRMVLREDAEYKARVAAFEAATGRFATVEEVPPGPVYLALRDEMLIMLSEK